MRFIGCFLTLLITSFILISKVEADDKWSWGEDESKSTEVTPRLSSGSRFASHGSARSSAGVSTKAKEPGVPEARTFGILKKLRCKLGLCNREERHQRHGPLPLYPGPVPIAHGPIPIYPGSFPVGPGLLPLPVGPGPLPFPVGPRPLPFPMGPGPLPLPVGPAPIPLPVGPAPVHVPSPIAGPPHHSKGYPPIHKPHTTKTEHQHIHTHIHESSNGIHGESPYKHTGYPPIKSEFAPTVVAGGPSHLDSHDSFGSHNLGNNHRFGIKSISAHPSHNIRSHNFRHSSNGFRINPLLGYRSHNNGSLTFGHNTNEFGIKPISGHGSHNLNSYHPSQNNYGFGIRPLSGERSHNIGSHNFDLKSNEFGMKPISEYRLQNLGSHAFDYSSNSYKFGIQPASVHGSHNVGSNFGYNSNEFGIQPISSHGSHNLGSQHFGQSINQFQIAPISGHGSHNLGHNNKEFGIKPISVYPEIATNPIYRPPNSHYEEECVCVLPHQCSPHDIVRNTLGKDISHLVNPRSEAVSVLSNDTSYTTPTRGKRDTLVTNRQPIAALSQTANGRAIGGYTPGLAGCDHTYVCCRSSHRDPNRSIGTCGKSLKSSIHGRIANTDYNQGATQFGEYPWQAAILKEDKFNYKNIFVCGATLISDQHVLTAAHCVVDEADNYLKIRLGEWDVNSETEFYKHIELSVKNVVIHPKYYAGNLENDIALITLQGYIDFHSYPHISPVCLPNAYSDFTYQHCVVTGWGKNAFGYVGDYQQILKEVEVPVVDRESCQYALQAARLGRDYYLPEGFICAGGEEGKDSCKGDGGGPLVCPTGHNTYELAGIVSWGIECGLRGVPGVYVNIPYYVDWINSLIHY